MQQKLTYEIARTAGHDAGNRSMRKAGRTMWNIDDYNTAARETGRLIDIIEEDDEAQIIV